MSLRCGIVGLPNVGKSTLFNALTASAAAGAANYPFCTVEPNEGAAPVPDPRLARIAALAESAAAVPSRFDFVDIAGLVAGASTGEGLGNRFLGHIREVDAIAHVLRCFDDDGVTHVAGRVDPVADAEVVETELLLADLQSLEGRRDGLVRKARGGDGEARAMLSLVDRAIALLAEGRPAREMAVADDERALHRQMQLLTSKPVLYVCNVGEGEIAGNALSRKVEALAAAGGAASVTISAAIEAEIALLEDERERGDFLASLGLERAGLERFVHAGYRLLGLITYFTASSKEARAWPLPRGATASEAAGNIHTDFARGFICAETVSYEDFIACGGEQGARDAGRMRQEGREYRVADGDVMLFRFNI